MGWFGVDMYDAIEWRNRIQYDITVRDEVLKHAYIQRMGVLGCAGVVSLNCGVG